MAESTNPSHDTQDKQKEAEKVKQDYDYKLKMDHYLYNINHHQEKINEHLECLNSSKLSMEYLEKTYKTGKYTASEADEVAKLMKTREITEQKLKKFDILSIKPSESPKPEEKKPEPESKPEPKPEEKKQDNQICEKLLVTAGNLAVNMEKIQKWDKLSNDIAYVRTAVHSGYKYDELNNLEDVLRNGINLYDMSTINYHQSRVTNAIKFINAQHNFKCAGSVTCGFCVTPLNSGIEGARYYCKCKKNWFDVSGVDFLKVNIQKNNIEYKSANV